MSGPCATPTARRPVPLAARRTPCRRSRRWRSMRPRGLDDAGMGYHRMGPAAPPVVGQGRAHPSAHHLHALAAVGSGVKEIRRPCVQLGPGDALPRHALPTAEGHLPEPLVHHRNEAADSADPFRQPQAAAQRAGHQPLHGRQRRDHARGLLVESRRHIQVGDPVAHVVGVCRSRMANQNQAHGVVVPSLANGCAGALPHTSQVHGAGRKGTTTTRRGGFQTRPCPRPEAVMGMSPTST